MAAPDRVIAQAGSGPTVSGSIQDELTGLWDQSDVRLTNIAGTADVITADLVPALTAGITAGMKFSFIAAATNSGAVTIAINGGAAIAVTNDDGDALAAGLIVAGRIHKLESDGTALRLIGATDIQKVNNVQTFTEDGTWTKPAGTPGDALVRIYAIGAGGGGGASTGEGGGGGGCGLVRVMRAGDLPGTVAVTIGVGGTVETAGSNTSFGSYLVAYGGGRSSSGGGGGGGSPFGAGGGSSGNVPGKSVGAGGTGGAGGTDSTDGGNGGDSTYGGGGGGGGHSASFRPAGSGGYSVYGGGGGAGHNSGGGANGTAGLSLYAGNGGEPGQAGVIPGGGGGRNGAGARGQLTVHVIG